MIDYGAGPSRDDLEIVVFGPGYGEAIAVHLGDQKWLLVDSCIDPFAKAPASLVYLQSIGVSTECVVAIVATHWHDDHVRGISQLARACPNAEFQLSSAFNSDEAFALLAAYSGAVAPALARGTRELFEATMSRDDVYQLHQRCSVLELTTSGGRQVRVSAMSPTQGAVTRSVAHLAQFLPVADGEHSIGHIAPLKPNGESVVIHVDFGEDAVLLGADLEEHDQFGWTAVASDVWVKQRRRASVYKVAHHGSHTGESGLIWENLLETGPTVALTPFNKGSQALPTDLDRKRVVGRAGAAYITSRAGRRPRIDSASMKRLGDVVKDLKPVNNGFGALRIRKTDGAAKWAVDCFGDACPL